MIKLFENFPKEEKIKFFLKCQELLVNYHPTSSFIFREDNIDSRKEFIMNFYNKYKGYAYFDDNICILYNKIFIDNQNDLKHSLKDNVFKPPVENYNSILVDFCVFNNIKNSIEFIKSQYTTNILYILYVKNSKIRLYKAESLINNIK